jgi:hypothetical protein
MAEIIQEARHRFLTMLKGIFWHFFEEGFCTDRALSLLLEAVDRGLDHDLDPLTGWEFIKKYFSSHRIVGCMGKCRKTPLLGYFFKKSLFSKLSFEYDVLINFIEAHDVAREMLCETILTE